MWWFVFGFVSSVISVGALAASDGASPDTWILIFALMAFGACALGAMAVLARHGDPLGGLLLGITLGPIGLLLAILRAKELAKRPKPDPPDDAG
jgi:hypothetical protein